MQRRDFLKWVSLCSASAALPPLLASCNSLPFTEAGASGKPLKVGVQPWAGFLGQYVALEKDFFSSEGLTVEAAHLPSATDANAALVAQKVDLAWVGIPDVLTLVAQAPSLKVVMVSDYSNGSDGILGRDDISRAEDLWGKKVARENTPFTKIFLGSYLKQAGLTEKDLDIVSLSAGDAAAAFAAGRVDVAVTYEPWLSNTLKETKARILFTTKDTNIIPAGLAASAETIASRRGDILRYIRAIDRGIAFSKTNAEEAYEICAEKLEVAPTEIPAQLAGIRILDLKDNQESAMNLDSRYSLVRSLKSGGEVAAELGLIPKSLDTASLVDDSLVKSL